jgi:hypothetical protein
MQSCFSTSLNLSPCSSYGELAAKTFFTIREVVFTYFHSQTLLMHSYTEPDTHGGLGWNRERNPIIISKRILFKRMVVGSEKVDVCKSSQK